jgi:hypothetical protein
MMRLVETMNDRQISRLYGCTSPVIARWRDFHGLTRSLRQSGGNTTKWATDRDYFATIDTPAKAYILGFLVADGHVHKGGYRIEVSTKEADADQLRAIAREVGCDAPIRPMTNGYDGSTAMRLQLFSRKLVSDLNGLGLYHDKSTTATWPSVPADLEGHLARGLWDGDGYIGRGQFELVGTSELLDGLTEAVRRHTGCVLRRRMSGKDRRYHYAYGTRRDSAALHWMYSDAGISLARKQERYLQFWSQIPRT